MLPKAIENRMYLSKLTAEESIAVLGHEIAIHLRKEGDYENAIRVAKRLIKLFPNYAPLYLSRGAAFHGIIMRDYQSKYPNADDIPDDLRPGFIALMQQNNISYVLAENLGWTVPSDITKQKSDD